VTGPPDPADMGRTLDRAAHRRRDTEWLAQAWSRGWVVVIDRNRALVMGDPPRLVLVEPERVPQGDRLFLGVDGGDVPYFAVAGPLPEVADAKSATLRGVGDVLDPRDRDLLSAAAGLVNWHSRYGFSPATGEPTEVGEAGWIRRSADGETLSFPRTDPAVIVLINDGQPGERGRCVLARGTGWPEGRYSCLAGFVEPGESAEATVVRETTEESGLTVWDVRYVTSQPWPFPGSLMLAFTALGDPMQPFSLDPTELADARWFTRSELRELWLGRSPIRSSVAYYLTSRWLDG